jgi:diguanylate cyclase (GGDEF)-like protein
MRRRLRPVYALLGLLLIAYLGSEIFRASGQSWPWLDNWGVAAFETAASLLCITHAVVLRRGRAAIMVLGFGLLSWSIGDFVLAAESVGGATPAVPSLADAFYLGFYPLTYVGVMLLVRRQVKGFSATTWLDGAVAGLGAAAVCAEFAFKAVAASAGGDAATVATNLAYPVGDILLLLLVAGVTTVLPDRLGPRWLMLAAGYLINTIGDTANLFHSSIGASQLATMLDAVAWPTSILLVSCAVWLPLRQTRRGPLHERPPGLVLPSLATAAAVVILLLASWGDGGHVAAGLATATLVLAGVRLALAQLRLRALTEERHAQAITDELTALGNRRALFELLDHLLSEVAEDEEVRRVAFLFVDLNRFKEVNDSFGHAVGDELLRQLGARLKGSLRSTDLLVRLGGDEFAVVLLDAEAEYGAQIAQRIAMRLEEPFLLGDVRARIGASIGIAVTPDDAATPAELLQRADLAMYRAKVDGKPYAIYQAEIDGRGNRLGLAEDLRLAIEERQLEVHYQPQINIATGEIVALEALVRWQHPHMGNIPPLDFLPLAEDADLMDLLTAAVLDEALAQCLSWRRQGTKVTVAVNVSATNLLNPEFPRLVDDLLKDHGLAPEALALEITETTAMADFHRCKMAVHELHELGLTVSVDDFGAGFTSLAYLNSLAVGELKLDRSFISGLAGAPHERDLALVRSTIDLAHALGLRVVAEGVEDEASLELLAQLGCDLAQGYLISKPLPAPELGLEPYGPLRARRVQAA